MKKLLVLVLVLGLATAANAFVADLTGDNTEGAGSQSVDITSGGDIYLMVAIQGSGTIAITGGVAAPPDSALLATNADAGIDGIYGQGEVWIMANIATSVYSDGSWLSISYSDAVAGDVVTVYDYDGDVTFTALDSITIIPEPMTLALLGLGGLFIRRK